MPTYLEIALRTTDYQQTLDLISKKHIRFIKSKQHLSNQQQSAIMLDSASRLERITPANADNRSSTGQSLNDNPRAKLTSAATRARMESWKRIPASDRRRIGLRLQAIHGGLSVQRMYRLRGIDAAAHARQFRKPKKNDTPKTTRSKVLPIA